MAALRAGDGAEREAAPRVLRTALAAAEMTPARTEVVTTEVMDTLWPPAAAGTAPDRDARFAAWLEALEALAGDSSTAWLVEDIHWAGGDLLAFLSQAATWPSGGGRLVVATARPSVLEHLAEGASVLELPPLPAPEAGELIRALIGAALPDEVVMAVAERSDGNPLFIEELLRSWISSGTLGRDGPGWRLAVAPEAVPLPATVQAIYAGQLDDLPAAARLVARRASVAGRRFAVRALEPLGVPDPDDGLASLRQRAFLRGPESDLTGDDIYAYRHALLRDAGYASLSRAERGRLHLALATWLEQTAGTDVARVAEPIASHYESALSALPAVGVDPEQRTRLTAAARSWLERAADAALGVAAHEAAIGLLARAVTLAGDDELEAARIRLRRGELLATTGDMDVGIGEMETALEVSRRLFHADDDRSHSDAARELYGRSMVALGDAYIEQIRFTEARDRVAEVLAEITPPDDVIVGRLMALHAWANVSQGDRDGTIEEAERALALVGAADPDVILEVLERRARVRLESEEFTPEDWQALVELARQQEHWGITARAIQMRAGNMGDAMAPREVMALLDEALEVAQTHGLTEAAVFAHVPCTMQRFEVGDWDDALRTGYEGIEQGERNAYVRAVFRIWTILAPILTARGEAEPIERYASWFKRNRVAFPDPPSAFGAVLDEALNVRLRSLGRGPAVDRPITPETVGTEAYRNPEFLEALETIIGDRIRDGDAGFAADASKRVVATYSAPTSTWPTTHLELASLSLHTAWVARAEGAWDVAEAKSRDALNEGRAAEAPWWVARAIRAIPDGSATREEMAEAEEIERRLRVVPGATAPPV